MQLEGSWWAFKESHCNCMALQVELASEKFPVNVMVAEIPTTDLILGRDFLHYYGCVIEMSETVDVLHMKSRGLKLPISKDISLSRSPSLTTQASESTPVQ